ncbi:MULTISPECIES: MurR/RpiR family transcriptional regulator [Citrobacter]|jgi:DNA-binding MurR/RpiR family transcriptional regulator|uniref:MurR/RpiR family transcriptional regulator n=1 Tax=Citrobacter braakii TaxID=57706 RepID=A0ABR6TZC5_CITBR|nr:MULTISPECIES: MurR/RpiR family transcriptional regulator [Citrobacter]ASE42524.1 MurR/RpiR family transcriptional regulator [Citrobacter braakii]EGT0621110.1 MurR/RpiR family transcriptional regulator [Citrobacter braakii]EGT0674752.1 MurR/RpiR family transcriptional regulator [Citrobacter braakii]EGT5657083.1 MurR/RpiR family transcriptional regulator [Citrobacter braakii]EHG7889003.1 MurR/RpiR family transcriptional regulator [Citrobacter braakii]
MDNRLASLLTRGEPLTRAEYRVLAHLTQHPLLVGNITVRELAQATFVSTATIMRLCQKLGFSGFSEFIWHCKQLLSDTPHIAAQAAESGELPAMLSRFIANYQLTFQWNTQEKRRHFVDLLRQKESFFLYGAGFSYLFAEYLTKKLQVLGKTAFISGPGDSRNIFLSNAARYQVFVAVSRSGETEQVIDKVRIAQNVGMTIVAFTRASANSLAGMADLHFALYDEAVHFAAEAAGVTSFESNLVLLMDLLLLEATG